MTTATAYDNAPDNVDDDCYSYCSVDSADAHMAYNDHMHRIERYMSDDDRDFELNYLFYVHSYEWGESPYLPQEFDAATRTRYLKWLQRQVTQLKADCWQCIDADAGNPTLGDDDGTSSSDGGDQLSLPGQLQCCAHAHCKKESQRKEAVAVKAFWEDGDFRDFLLQHNVRAMYDEWEAACPALAEHA